MVQRGEQNDDGANVTIVLADSDDVMRSVGHNDVLPRRLRASAADSPGIRTHVIRGWRCDVLAERLNPTPTPQISAPERLEPWLQAELEAPHIPSDALLFVRSMSAVTTSVVVRHRTTGCRVQLPADYPSGWSAAEIAWVEANFDPLPADTTELSDALASIATDMANREIEFVVFNLSTYTPEEKAYWFRTGDQEPLALTAARVDLMMDLLPPDLNVTVISIDRIAAEFGAKDAVTSAGHLTDEACAVIAEEVAARVVDLPNVSAHFSPEIMRLAIPRYDRRTDEGVLEAWHVAAPSEIKAGDTLCDIRFQDLHTRVNADVKRKSDRALRMSVVATRDGYLRRITCRAGDPIEAGSTVGVVTTSADVLPRDTDDAAHFPVGVRLASP